jgi:glutaminyl-peptide cyclotransferase
VHPALTRVARGGVFALMVVLVVACVGQPAAADGAPLAAIQAGLAAGVPLLHPAVLATVPHDPSAWTEGLEIDDGVLYESTGLAGRSQLRQLDPVSGALRRIRGLPDRLYGEGLTVLGGRIWQLTWTDHLALDWPRDAATGADSGPRRVPWRGEGWGLCHLGGRLVVSDGTDRLRVLTGPELTEVGSVPVRMGGRALAGLNELECTAAGVWANVYPTSWLVRVDPGSGQVTAAVDAEDLLAAAERAAGAAVRPNVLNGIAAIPGTDEFLLTGKLWPTMYRVRFVPPVR